MTTAEPTIESTAPAEPELCWLNLADLAPHPDNPRGSLGDLTELVRSIQAHGILEPLVVLPADGRGVYAIVAGHRRHAAGLKAGVTDAPAVIRPMTPVEVVEAMLSENVNRSDLTVAEEVRAIERLMSLDTGLTPAKLCRRIGKSQAWVRTRMAVTVLPASWRAALDRGELTLAAAEAAATLADLGPDHLDAICSQLAGRAWIDPSRAVANYRDELRRAEHYERTVERTRAKHPIVYTSEDAPPDRAKRLGELFDSGTAKAHRDEPCHAVVVRRVNWSDGADTFEVCTDPRRHRSARGDTGSDLTADNARPSQASADTSHAKRKGRVARLAHATEIWGKPRGGIAQGDLTRLALRGLICEAEREAIGYAATILGYEQPREVTHRDLLAAADNPAKLARVAGAVACGLAETAMYWSPSSTPCRDYLGTLTATGWTPDQWTADAITRTAEADSEPDEDDDGDGDADDDPDDGEDDPDLD